MTHFLRLVVLAACALPFVAVAQVGPPQDRYIVVLNEGFDLPGDVAADIAIQTGGRVGYVYASVLRGFSITMPRVALNGVARDPRVAYVEADIPVSIVAQNIPTGIDRIFATDNQNLGIDGTDDYRVDVDVAVLDTGIDVDHPELDVAGGANCLQSTGCDPTISYDDDHYHGTHVAGTIGAIDNGAGVVGVAPGARLWAVKVLDSSGSGYLSGIVAGIDWVRAMGGIEVINMSLGGSGTSEAMNTAITNAVAAGITVVVAAGNSDADASGFTPANAPDAFTVSALADFDGAPGGLGSPTCRTDQDDTLADFSNWGKVIDIAAPGVCILSTYPVEKGSYGTISGTSMAAPHVAGAAALLASGSPSPINRDDVLAIWDALTRNGNFDWTDDSGDGVKEPLLDISNTSIFAPVLIASGGDGGDDPNNPPTANFSYACTDLTCKFTDTSTDGDGTIASWAWDFNNDGTVDSSVQNPTHSFSAGGNHIVTLTVTDDDGATESESKTISVSDGSGSVNDIYVWAISMSHKDYGPRGSFKDLSTTVSVKRDSDADGTAESGDEPGASANVTIEISFGGTVQNTSTVQTDSNGNATYTVKRLGATGEYTATITNVTHGSHDYNPSLNVETSDTHLVD